jgi:surface antigen
MRSPVCFVLLGVGAACLLALLASADLAAAEDAKPSPSAPCACSGGNPASANLAGPRKPQLDEDDEIAALEAIRVALSEVGDGSTFVWQRRNGRVSGLVRPTASFKDASGRICRHIMLILNSGTQTGKIEGIACRLDNGRWQLEG